MEKLISVSIRLILIASTTLQTYQHDARFVGNDLRWWYILFLLFRQNTKDHCARKHWIRASNESVVRIGFIRRTTSTETISKASHEIDDYLKSKLYPSSRWKLLSLDLVNRELVVDVDKPIIYRLERISFASFLANREVATKKSLKWQNR